MTEDTTKNETIEGEIIFREILSSFSFVTGYVFLEEVSRADAPSVEIARIVLHGISMDKDHIHSIPFRLIHPILGKHELYTISVLIDIDGDGKISPGDYITTESYPVTLYQKFPLKVYVQPVK